MQGWVSAMLDITEEPIEVAPTAHYSMGQALSLGDASFVLPMDFLRLPCIAVVALLLFGERIDGWTMAGAVFIFAGNYWSVRGETRRAAPALG